MEYTYSGYRILCVYGQVDSELAQELVDFWMGIQGLMNLREARARVSQVASIARNKAGRLAGVSTVYPFMLNPGQQYYTYRMFVQPADRVSGMARFMERKTREHFRGLKIKDKPEGIAIETQNIKLMRPGMLREFKRAGYTCIEKTPRGCDLWIHDF